MPETESHIPTLTDILLAGNADMRNHFDAHQFNDEDSDSEGIIEDASEIENSGQFTASDLNDIPSIKLETDSANVDAEDLTAAIPSVKIKDTEQTIDKADLKDKIDHAVADALPFIEISLKRRLYKELGL